MFQEYHLTEPSLKGYVQTVALDVSEIYYNSEEIKRNNEKLAKLNQKLEEMYEPIQPSLIKKTNMKIPKDMQKNLVFPFRSRAAIQILPHTGALQIALFVNA